MVPALEAAGAIVTVATTDKGADDSDGDFLVNTDVRVFRSARPTALNWSPELNASISEMISKVDIVHIHSIHTMTSTVAMRVARGLGVPYVLQPHGALDSYHLNQGHIKKRIFTRLLDSRNLRDLSGVIYSSQRESRFGRIFLPNTPDFEVALGVDSKLFDVSRLHPSGTAPSVLFLGRVTEKKRLDLLIHAFNSPRVRKFGAKLIVAGPIDERLRYDPVLLARELGLSEAVTFLGKVDAKARERLLAESSIFALPSEDESFGVAAAEAVASGCPTLLSANVGIADSLASIGGTQTSELNEDAIARAIETLLRDPGESAAMAERGASFARKNYTWSSAAAQTLGAYDSVLGRPND